MTSEIERLNKQLARLWDTRNELIRQEWAGTLSKEQADQLEHIRAMVDRYWELFYEEIGEFQIRTNHA